MKATRLFSTIALTTVLLSSCTKYKDVADAGYSDQQIYMPTAVEGNSTSGVYSVNKVATPGVVFRYKADVAGKKLNIPLAVYRSGTNTTGTVAVNVATRTDTVSKLILANRLPVGTEVLTAGKFSVPASVSIANGAGYTGFDLAVDLDFLLANPSKKFAIAVGVSSNDRKASQFNTTVVLIDPVFLTPIAAFTTVINARTVNFSNISLNANAYTWDYGDGTPISTGAALPHTYAAAGTYTIKLVASGALGDFNKATITATVVIP